VGSVKYALTFTQHVLYVDFKLFKNETDSTTTKYVSVILSFYVGS